MNGQMDRQELRKLSEIIGQKHGGQKHVGAKI
jgi:hypothetical protein